MTLDHIKAARQKWTPDWIRKDRRVIIIMLWTSSLLFGIFAAINAVMVGPADPFPSGWVLTGFFMLVMAIVNAVFIGQGVDDIFHIGHISGLLESSEIGAEIFSQILQSLDPKTLRQLKFEVDEERRADAMKWLRTQEILAAGGSS